MASGESSGVTAEHAKSTSQPGGRLRRAARAYPTEPEPERHIEVEHPGEVVQMDCFCFGRPSGAKSTAWQYTAIDVASAYTRAEPDVTPQIPPPADLWAGQRLAADLAARRWRLEAVTSDEASESSPSLHSRRTSAEQWLRAILEECWRTCLHPTSL